MLSCCIPDSFNTLGEANEGFDVVLSNIVQELNIHINQNVQQFESTCYYLAHKVLVELSQEDKEQIANSKSYTDIKNVMDPHWNWSSHHLLYIIIKRLNSTKCLEMLQRFDGKINKQIQLKDIHKDLLSRTTQTQSSSYCKMTAIVEKDYSKITLEEGLQLEEVILDYLGLTAAHSSKAYEPSSNTPCTEMQWSISTTAVENLCTEATKHKEVFISQSFLSLKIGNFTVFNKLYEVSFVLCIMHACIARCNTVNFS